MILTLVGRHLLRNGQIPDSMFCSEVCHNCNKAHTKVMAAKTVKKERK